MKVQITTTIGTPAENIWKTIRSYDNVERFLPIVTSSTITGTDEGSERVCQVQFGDHQAELIEKLDSVDEENKIMKFTIVKAPSPFGGQQVTYQVKSLGENKAEVLISTKVADDNKEATKGIQDVFQMAANGLKKLHEKEETMK
ncbi:MAG: SRPBCC family protein [Nitrosopumilus sp.]